MIGLRTNIADLNRIGKITAKRLAKLGIFTAQDLLLYFPFRYDSFDQTKIKNLTIGQKASVFGTIEMIDNRRSHRSKINITEALITDNEEALHVVWFNQPFLTKNLKVGDQIFLAGKVEEDFQGLLMKSPVYEKKNKFGNIHTEGLVPNYHLTADLTQKQLRFQIKQVITLAKQLPDWLPKNIQKAEKLISLEQAIYKIHFPHNQQDIDLARRRLAFNELFILQLQIQLARLACGQNSALPLAFFTKKTKDFVQQLPFVLTVDQKKASWEIITNLQKNKPMTRLLEGDVGSGKTIVALLAIFNALLNHIQVALLAPTEILAKQHYDLIIKLFADYNFKIGLFSRSNRFCSDSSEQISKQEIKEKIKNQKIDFIIGTHALIQEDIQFANLGFVVIDEQHRFGVEQRHKLFQKTNKNIMPHLLTMTATPIPRSLTLALYDDLDISVIKHLPQGRKKTITKIITNQERTDVYKFTASKIEKGEQVFIVCPLIDWSDKLGAKSVKQEYEKISKQIFPKYKIAMLHGKMKAKEKNKILESFAQGEFDVLVATSVIEVGIDIPRATIMIVEDAERFGLAQLHQYRGRIGRNDKQAFCFLMAERKNKRLQAMLEHDNGFALAKADLSFRGPGEVYGTLQKGFPQLKIASLFDFAIMKQAKTAAQILLQKDKDLLDFPLIKAKLKENNLDLHFE